MQVEGKEEEEEEENSVAMQLSCRREMIPFLRVDIVNSVCRPHEQQVVITVLFCIFLFITSVTVGFLPLLLVSCRHEIKGFL